MTIDLVIEDVKEAFVQGEDGISTLGNATMCMIIEYLEELKQYKSQDLIRREDAIREGTIALRDLTVELIAIACKNEIEYRMNQIPRTEYKGGEIKQLLKPDLCRVECKDCSCREVCSYVNKE